MTSKMTWLYITRLHLSLSDCGNYYFQSYRCMSCFLLREIVLHNISLTRPHFLSVCKLGNTIKYLFVMCIELASFCLSDFRTVVTVWYFVIIYHGNSFYLFSDR